MLKYSAKICVGFDEETFNLLKSKAAHKKKKLIPYIRELVEIGLKVEEISAQSEDRNNNFKMDDITKSLWKSGLRCGVESLYLIRCLIDSLLAEKGVEYLVTAKQKAETYVEGLLKEQA